MRVSYGVGRQFITLRRHKVFGGSSAGQLFINGSNSA